MDLRSLKNFSLGDAAVKSDAAEPREERNTRVLRHWIPKWVQNSYENYAPLKKAKPKSLGGLVGGHKDIPAVVCGAGPSLDRELETIKKWQHKAIILASNSTLKTLLANGIIPDYTLFIHSQKHLKYHVQGVEEKLNYITHTCIHPEVLKTLIKQAGDLYMFNLWQAHPDCTFLGGIKFIDCKPVLLGDLHLAYRDYSVIFNKGCVANGAVLAAGSMGCDPILLAGVDFGYPDGQFKCREYKRDNGAWKEIQVDHAARIDAVDEAILRKAENVQGDQVLCEDVHVTYRDSMGEIRQQYQKEKIADVINTSETSILKNIPYKPLKEALAECSS